MQAHNDGKLSFLQEDFLQELSSRAFFKKLSSRRLLQEACQLPRFAWHSCSMLQQARLAIALRPREAREASGPFEQIFSTAVSFDCFLLSCLTVPPSHAWHQVSLMCSSICPCSCCRCRCLCKTWRFLQIYPLISEWVWMRYLQLGFAH